ncbi:MULTISPECIES: MarR family winged helix-turn-helix transcriptional regulator [unclassified Myxococcus]|uniref:MarR family winged helix-turn-helix transcriptional regulator n=1 Tax=Myxococcus TaxID=32 RepID=UPI001142134E|nr:MULTISPECIES: MarR family transcriptional regulator [unclassified Myxococcus]NOK06521.1 MarR family transcriptional regulator [Myxococcus xanthus]
MTAEESPKGPAEDPLGPHEGERTYKGPPLGEVLEFMRLLWAVDHGLQSTSKRMESTLGLTGPQRLVIRLVGRFPDITAGMLAQILHVHPSTLTGVLKRLEKRGLLERKSDPLDGRKALFSLTDEGRSLDIPSEGTVESSVQRVLSRLSRSNIVATQEVLTALAQELGGVPMHEVEYDEAGARKQVVR